MSDAPLMPPGMAEAIKALHVTGVSVTEECLGEVRLVDREDDVEHLTVGNSHVVRRGPRRVLQQQWKVTTVRTESNHPLVQNVEYVWRDVPVVRE